MTNNPTQISAATALVQLLTEFPELPTASWTIGSVIPDLHGSVYEGADALAAYTAVLGGSVRPADDTFMLRGKRVRRHVLSAVWRDVPVEVAALLPVAAEAVAA
ncbi:hypothetical protein ACFYQQ_00925 [Streptomyces sp. NPDC005496]|uniref:hypothetical protein n=1 Tax=unclassified Streptomyces TaxID=2593676 RepID=UPI0033B80074